MPLNLKSIFWNTKVDIQYFRSDPSTCIYALHNRRSETDYVRNRTLSLEERSVVRKTEPEVSSGAMAFRSTDFLFLRGLLRRGRVRTLHPSSTVLSFTADDRSCPFHTRVIPTNYRRIANGWSRKRVVKGIRNRRWRGESV